MKREKTNTSHFNTSDKVAAALKDASDETADHAIFSGYDVGDIDSKTQNDVFRSIERHFNILANSDIRISADEFTSYSDYDTLYTLAKNVAVASIQFMAKMDIMSNRKQEMLQELEKKL